jgi:sialate O-acetylesterase
MNTRLLLAALCVLAPIARAEIKLPAVIGSNMVLQQRSQAPLWGWDNPGQSVSVSASWADKPVGAKADAKGKWTVRLATPAAGAGPYAITITGSNTVRLDNVLIGEVWLCSGQSNMEMCVGDAGGGYRGVQNWQKEAADANDAGIRLFDVANEFATAPREDCHGTWAVCTPERVKGFSATGYFFGRELRRSLNVPVGLISSDWGGTVAEAWTSEEGLKPFPEFNDAVEFVRAQRSGGPTDQVEAWRRSMAPFWAQLPDKDPGTREHWEAPAMDDASWRLMEVPGEWSNELATFDGIVWMRRPVYIRQGWGGKALTLDLGPIDDMDTTYFDGVRVGGQETPGFHDKPRRYTIPAERSTPGPHMLAIRILDTGGPGGLAKGPNTLHAEGDSETLDLSGYWRYQAGSKIIELPPIQAPRMMGPNTPTALYNGMIAPLVPFGIRGAIWYQGESNRGRADEYARLLPAMIGDWRRLWGEGEFPFYYVQIAPFHYGDGNGETPLLREAQLQILSTPHTGMAVTMDIGNPGDIHPANKQDVGRRLALWALAKTYERAIECSGPLFAAAKADGNALRLSFTHAEGLNSRGDPIRGFMVAGSDKAFVPAQARIDGDAVVVWSEKVPAPAAVRYGWGDDIQPNLFNGVNLPASPFRTDAWPP